MANIEKMLPISDRIQFLSISLAKRIIGLEKRIERLEKRENDKHRKDKR